VGDLASLNLSKGELKMGMYKYIQKLWTKPKENLKDLWKERLIAWRKEPVTVRLAKPTRIDRARSLGYKAKQGFLIVRQRLIRGGHVRESFGRRRPKRQSKRLDLDKSYQTIAEERAASKYVNCEVLNSYWVASDGKYHWYEVLLIDTAHPVIKKDKDIKWITGHKNRVQRGLTASGRKSRGLLNKGKGAEKLRPSRRANVRRRA